jgi:hypothetical protein
MTPQDLRAWQAHMGLTYDTSAQLLGVARSTYALYVSPHGQPPRAVALACAALAAGLKPWPQQQSKQT